MAGEKLNKSKKGPEKKGRFERGTRFCRDFNIAVGGVALIGAVIAPPVLAAGLGIYAGVNFAQAGAFEVARRYANKKSKKTNQNNSDNK